MTQVWRILCFCLIFIAFASADVYYLAEGAKNNGNAFAPADYLSQDIVLSQRIKWPDASFSWYGAFDAGQVAANESFYSKCLEAGVGIDIGNGWFVDLGKKKTKTGVGYFRKPTDYLKGGGTIGQNRSAASQEKVSEGLVGIDIAYMGEGVTFRGISIPRWDNDQQEQSLLSFASKFGDADYTVFLYRGDYASLGLNGNTVIGDSLELHMDSKWTQQMNRSLPSGSGSSTTTQEQNGVIDALLGCTYAFDPNTSLTIEYNYNGAGLEGSEYNEMLDYTQNYGPSLYDTYGLLSVAKHYLYERFAQTYTDCKLTLELMNANNLQDQSGFASIGLSQAYDQATVSLVARVFYGADRSEFGFAPIRSTFSAEVEMFL